MSATIEITNQPGYTLQVSDTGTELVVENVVTQVIEIVERGPQGIPGPAVTGGSDANYVHNQVAASAAWNVPHNLNKFCAVTIISSAGDVVIGEIHYVDVNNVTLSFAGAFSGVAFCN